MKDYALLQKTAVKLSLITALIGAAVLIGWKLDIVALKSVFPNQITMKPNTAMAFVICGIAIAFLPRSSNFIKNYLITFAAAIVLSLALLTLYQYLFQTSLGIDELLITDKTSDINAGRMSPTTAFCFVNIAIAIILSTQLFTFCLRKIFISAFSTTVIVIAGSIFFSYLPNMLMDYQILKSGGMGIHTSFAFVLLAVSLLLFAYSEGDFFWEFSPFVTFGFVACLIFILLSNDAHLNYQNEHRKNIEITNPLVALQKNKFNLVFYEDFLLSPLSVWFIIFLLCLGIFTINSGRGERKKMDSMRNKLAAIVDSSSDGIVSTNLVGIITSWNKGAEQIFGYTEKEMIGQLSSIVFPTDRLNEEAEILRHIIKGEKVEHFETVRKRKDGKLIDVSVTISPLRDENNVIIGASKIVSDITDNKLLEKQLRQSQKMSAISQLSGGVAHDFNNLLGIIIGNLDLLERSMAGNEEALKRTQVALKAAARGADITKRLLTFSRQQPLSSTLSNLNYSVENLIEMSSRILGNNIQVVTNLDSSLPLVFVDPAELETAILNLVVNARDAMPDGGKLMISTKLRDLDDKYPSVQISEISSGIYATISVTDTGSGILPEILEHVYEPFFTTKEREKGTGMGLAMVYGFAKQSGGTVKIYSEVGQGTTVTIYLPLVENISLPKVEITKKQSSFVATKALVVDDEADLLEIASLYLKDMGFEVYQAHDAASAIEIFKRISGITLLVTDIVMPGGINGIELAKQIRKINKDVKVIYASGFPLGKFSENVSTKIDSYFMSKPYQHEEFINKIMEALNNSDVGK
jgi:PAS domain S-box-containing protein